MLTLVVPEQQDDERDAVIAAWTQRGHSVCRLERFWQPPALDPDGIRLYGDLIFCLFLAEKFNLELVSPPDDLLCRLPFAWLGRQLQGIALAEAAQHSYPLFVKPLAPKLFQAAVYSDADALAQEVTGLPPDTSVIVSECVMFTNEVRCLVLHGDVVSASCYEGIADVEAATAFAQKFAAVHPVATTYVLDIGWIAGRGWAVIEANATWGAGLNGCDAPAMAKCLEAATTVQATQAATTKR